MSCHFLSQLVRTWCVWAGVAFFFGLVHLQRVKTMFCINISAITCTTAYFTSWSVCVCVCLTDVRMRQNSSSHSDEQPANMTLNHPSHTPVCYTGNTHTPGHTEVVTYLNIDSTTSCSVALYRSSAFAFSLFSLRSPSPLSPPLVVPHDLVVVSNIVVTQSSAQMFMRHLSITDFVVVVVMAMSHNAKHGLHAWGSDMKV